MLKLKNNGIPAEWLEAAMKTADSCGYEWGKDGLAISGVKRPDGGLAMARRGDGFEISAGKTTDFLLGVNLLAAGLREEISVSPAFDELGVMLDCSRNAVMQPEMVKNLMCRLSSMGYTYLELYCEDTYEVEGEPFFGYQRGRYTVAELRDLDAYAKSLGLALVPCVQTLAHVNAIFHWGAYASINDTGDILLADEPKTYELIDKMFSSLRKAFSTKRLHIGMDEAHMVGLGRYLDLHGYTNRFEILLRHLEKVAEIAKKYEFEPEMWSDMFFRLSFKEYYLSEIKQFPADVLGKIPSGIKLIYWDYYHTNQKDYECMFDMHKMLGDKVLFAGGAWKWVGFAPLNNYSLHTGLPALRAAKKKAVNDVLITSWGDDGAECSIFATVPALLLNGCYRFFGEEWRSYADLLAESCFGYAYDEMMSLEELNFPTVDEKGETKFVHPKSVLYDDVLLGTGLQFPTDEICAEYSKVAAHMQTLAAKKGALSRYFSTYALLALLLEKKSVLLRNIRAAYTKQDKKTLLTIAKEEIPETICRLDAFYEAFRAQWLSENKPFGFEVQEHRLGGLRLRLQSAGRRLEDYVSGKDDRMEELEGEALAVEPGGSYRSSVSPAVL